MNSSYVSSASTAKGLNHSVNISAAADLTVYSEKKPLHNVTIADMVQKKQEQFGIAGYYVPDNAWHGEKPRTFFSKQKKENIIEVIAKSKKDLPGPTTYKLAYDIKKLNGGKFLKEQRITTTD